MRDKFRKAVDDGKFAARVARQFFRSYRKWRDANPDEEVVYVYVGHPDMAATIVRQSPLWQRFAEWEKRQRDADVMFGRQNIESQAARDATAAVHRVAPLLRPAQCDCAACTASRATREESKAYDA